MLCIGVQLSYCHAHALGISGAIGIGTDDTKAYRLGLKSAWKNQWKKHCLWRVSGYWELSAIHLDNSASMQAYATAATLRFIRNHNPARQWFIDLGIGLSYASQTRTGERNLGMHLQFEDRIGFGVLVGPNNSYEIGYRLIHFSNGYLAQYNHGLNLHMLVLGYWF